MSAHTEPADPYAAAAARVDATPALEPYRAAILYDWTEPGHYAWAASCPLAELLDWAATVSAEPTVSADLSADTGCPECGAPVTDSHGTWHPSGTRGTCYVYACGAVACACPVRHGGES